MCKCTPNIRTPFCGKVGCEWPSQEVKAKVEESELVCDQFNQWASSHNRENYGRYDAFRAGYDLAKRKLHDRN